MAKTMPRTSPAPTCDRAAAGFSLVEVLVAVALTALLVASAGTAILTARSASVAGAFYRNALLQAEWLQAEAYGITVDDPPQHMATVERETITRDADGQVPDWQVFTLRAGTERRLVFCLQGAAAP